MPKINKRYIIILGVVVLLAVILTNTGEEAWQPLSTPKKAKKSKQITYLDLRKDALLSDSAVSVPVIPTPVKDPFKSSSFTHRPSGKAAEIKRNYTLKGIVSGNPLLATILDGAGESHVVQAGEAFEGAKVVKVTENSVTLKDAYGMFTILQK